MSLSWGLIYAETVFGPMNQIAIDTERETKIGIGK